MKSSTLLWRRTGSRSGWRRPVQSQTRLRYDKVFKAAAERDIGAARNALDTSGAAAASTETEAEALRSKIVFLARVFSPELDDAAQDASAAFDHLGPHLGPQSFRV